MRIIETATDYEIWDGSTLFSWCEKANTEYIERLATILEIPIEDDNPDDDSIS